MTQVAVRREVHPQGARSPSVGPKMGNPTNFAPKATHHAISRGGDPHLIGRAQRHLADGDSKDASSEPSKAAGKFRAPLEKALSA